MFNKISTEFLRYNLLRLPQLVFEVTDACNLRCKYCGYAELYGGYDKRENLYFPFERAKILIDYLYGLWRENGIKETCSPITISFYGGEPLLNVPFIKRVIDYLEQLPPVGKRFYYGMTSNAMLLDKYMDFLAEKEEEYTEMFANPYQAAKYGYIDDVIEPRNTRFRICRGLAQLSTKRESLPAKKHGNIPM